MQRTITALKEHIANDYDGATTLHVYEYAGDIDDKLKVINQNLMMPAALVSCAEGSDDLDEGETAMVIYIIDDSRPMDAADKRQGVAQAVQDLVDWLKTHLIFNNGVADCVINIPIHWRTLKVTDRLFLAQIGLDVTRHFTR